MKKSVILLVCAVSTLSYAQNDNGQGDQNGHPAVPSQGNGALRPHVWIHQVIGRDATLAPGTVLNPSQVTGAYGINVVAGFGQGSTVAIVDAYDASNAASDLAAFSSNFGVSCSTGGGTFTKVNQSGQASPLPGSNSGWEVESSLDVQWVHSIAPCANIVLVEANSNSYSDLMTAVSTAATLGSVVSMSWGSSEYSGQTSYDGFFIKSGVTFLASSGDTGGVIEWPSSSPNVIGVGGTDLTLNTNGTVASETAWSGSGGGCSTVEAAIGAQSGFVPSSCHNRAAPDVSMDGGGTSPVYVYISDQGGWYAVYGTSLAVQLWAGVVALANGLRGEPLNGTLADLYTYAAGAPSSTLYIDNYRDITSGTAGSFSASPGWDFVTGLGSPLANSLVPSYLANSSSASFSLGVSPGSQSVVRGSGTSFTVTVTGSNGFNGSVGFTTSGLPSGASVTFNPSSVTGSGSTTMNVATTSSTPTGSFPVTITGTSSGLVSKTSVTLVVTPAPTPNFSVTASPSSDAVVQGSPASYTATVTPSNGFDSAVTFSVSGLPSGAGASFSPTSVTGSGQSTMNVTTSATTPTGTYTLTIKGASGVLSHTTTVTLVVNPSNASFTIIATPNSQNVEPGSSTTFTVTVDGSGGFAGRVSFSVSGLPSRASESFSPSSVTGSGSTMLTILTNRKTSAGTSQVKITGTSGNISSSTTVMLVVQ